jgi:hypothetical protein
MNYFRLKQRRIVDEDGEDFDVFQFECEDDAAVDLPWLRGIQFKNPPAARIALRLEDGSPDEGAFVDYLGRPVPLVSLAFKQALLQAGASNVEFYEVEIAGCAAHADFPGYVAMNVVGKVAVADPLQSKSERAFGVMGADLFDKLVPRANLETGLQIFRMAEQVTTLVVSEAVKRACESLGIVTLEFVPLAPPTGP